MDNRERLDRRIKWQMGHIGMVSGCAKCEDNVAACMGCEKFGGYLWEGRIQNVPIAIQGHRRHMADAVICIQTRRKKQ